MNRLPRVPAALLPAVAMIMGLSAPAAAEKIDLVPVTGNPSLTMTTDESYGYQVFPRKPCRIKLVGPGRLTVTVRLNHARRLKVMRGRLTISRNGRRIRNQKLKLHRSRIGSYREVPGLHPSLPKVFRIKVPKGLQEYTFSVRGARGISMTVGFAYESKADQSAARSDESLALVPLVPPGGGGKSSAESDLPPLVPLVPPGSATPKSAPAKPQQAPAPRPAPAVVAASKPAPTPVPKPAATASSATTTSVPPKPRSPQQAPKSQAPASRPPSRQAGGTLAREAGSTERTPGGAGKAGSTKPQVRQLTTTVAQPPRLAAAAPSRRLPVVSLGVKFGQISPLQKVGGTTYTGSIDLRYILPIWQGRLSLGVEAGYYRYQLTVTSEQRRLTMMVIPVAVQVFYRFPIGAVIAPYVGAGVDLFVCLGKDSHTSTDFEYAATTKFTFGGHLAGGVEAKLGPGYLLGEVRGGMSFGDPGLWANSPNIYGLLAVAGYRFVF